MQTRGRAGPKGWEGLGRAGKKAPCQLLEWIYSRKRGGGARSYEMPWWGVERAAGAAWCSEREKCERKRWMTSLGSPRKASRKTAKMARWPKINDASKMCTPLTSRVDDRDKRPENLVGGIETQLTKNDLITIKLTACWNEMR